MSGELQVTLSAGPPPCSHGPTAHTEGLWGGTILRTGSQMAVGAGGLGWGWRRTQRGRALQLCPGQGTAAARYRRLSQPTAGRSAGMSVPGVWHFSGPSPSGEPATLPTGCPQGDPHWLDGAIASPRPHPAGRPRAGRRWLDSGRAEGQGQGQGKFSRAWRGPPPREACVSASQSQGPHRRHTGPHDPSLSHTPALLKPSGPG